MTILLTALVIVGVIVTGSSPAVPDEQVMRLDASFVERPIPLAEVRP